MGELVDPATLQKIGEGREAETFALGPDRALRLFLSGYSSEAIDGQVSRMRMARDAGIRVPEVYETMTVGDRIGVVLERIEGTDLLTDIGRRPWRIFHAARICGRAHAAINEAIAPNELRTVRDKYRLRIEESADLPGDVRSASLRSLDGLPEGNRLCHLDFHPANVMGQDSQPVVIDWANAARGPAEADFARTTLMLQLGDPPPGTSIALRGMVLVGRRIFQALYTRSYRRLVKIDERALALWELPTAVVRVLEGIEVERPALERLIMSHMRSA